MYKNNWLFLVLILALALTTACAGAETSASVEEVQPFEETDYPVTEEPVQGKASPTAEGESNFPLPEDVDASMIRGLGDGAINFETSLSLPDVINFYFSAFIDLGYKERRILTAITDTRFSIVFDGHPSGKAIIIQGTAFDEGVKIDLRLEDI